ncbi:hypothetical protein PHLCEN_2v768, partial [Hermanssonia centrifuga]
PLCLGITGQDCDVVQVVEDGDSCAVIAGNAGVELSVLLANNPNVNSECSNIYVGEPATPATAFLPRKIFQLKYIRRVYIMMLVGSAGYATTVSYNRDEVSLLSIKSNNFLLSALMPDDMYEVGVTFCKTMHDTQAMRAGD